MYKYFFGSFNKRNNHRDCEYLKKELGIDYYFDEKTYNEVAFLIRNTFKSDGIYSVQDAYRFLQSQYAAYPIDIRYYYNYIDTSVTKVDSFNSFTISKDSDIDVLSEPCGAFYSYIKKNDKKDSPREQSLCLVIDVIGNSFLRERYPEIKEGEENAVKIIKGLQKSEDGEYSLSCGNEKIRCVVNSNIIIAIGSFDGYHINSMKILSGEKILPKLDYVLEFFRRHS